MYEEGFSEEGRVRKTNKQWNHRGKSLLLYGVTRRRPANFFDHHETRRKLHAPKLNGKDSATLASYPSHLYVASPGISATQTNARGVGEKLLNDLIHEQRRSLRPGRVTTTKGGLVTIIG